MGHALNPMTMCCSRCGAAFMAFCYSSTCEPPARYSANDGNPNVASQLEVLFNGIPRDGVVSYDVRARTLTRHMMDDWGNIVTDRAGAARLETWHGDVAVRWKGE